MQIVASKKIYLWRDFAAGVYLSEAPSPIEFLRGVVKQCCELRIWPSTQCKTPAEYGLQQNPIPPPPPHYMLYTEYIYSHKEGVRGAELNQRVGESTDHKAGLKYQHEWMTEVGFLQSKSLYSKLWQTPAAKSLYRSMTTFCIAFYESYLSTGWIHWCKSVAGVSVPEFRSFSPWI